MHQVTFSSEGFKGYDYRRVGRPRGHWAETTITETLKETEELDYERDNTDHLVMIFVNILIVWLAKLYKTSHWNGPFCA